MKYIFCVCFICLLGCSGSCISLKGEYKDFAGEVQWCLEKEISKEVGKDILQNSEGELAIVLNEKDVARANEILNAPPTAKIKALREENTFRKFLELIKK